MDKQERRSLKDTFWSWLEADLNSYTQAIEDLLDTLTPIPMTSEKRSLWG